MVAQLNANETGAEVKKERHWMIGKDAINSKAVHHQGIKELWEKKWKFPVLIPRDLNQLVGLSSPQCI